MKSHELGACAAADPARVAMNGFAEALGAGRVEGRAAMAPFCTVSGGIAPGCGDAAGRWVESGLPPFNSESRSVAFGG